MHRTRLALTSLLLALAPLVALGLIRLVTLAVDVLPGVVVTVLSVLVYAGSFLGSLGAAVTGWQALRRAEPPLPWAVRAAAVAGIVLGVTGMVLVVVAAGVVVWLSQYCRVDGNCG
jgi:hypothetical protein